MRIVIPLNPVTKKNSQQIVKAKGRYIIIPSKQYRQYEKACAPYLMGLVKEPISKKINIKCLFYMATRRKIDLVNLLEAIDDIFTNYGIIADDNANIVVSHDGSRVLYDKENPRTEIEITEVA